MNRRAFFKALGVGVPAAVYLPKSGILEAFAKLLAPVKRVLRAEWHVLPTNTLSAYHNLDLESEIAAYLADEIRFEIDNEIMNARTTS